VSIHLSIRLWHNTAVGLLLWAQRAEEISTDCSVASGQHQPRRSGRMRVVPLCRPTWEAERVLVELWSGVQKFKTLLIAELSKVFPNEMAKYRSLRGDERL